MARRPVDGLSLFDSDFESMSIDGFLEALSRLGGDVWSGGPGLLGRRSGRAMGSGGGVGLGLSVGEVIAGPVAGAIVASGVVRGSRCQRAAASFNGAIVLRVI